MILIDLLCSLRQQLLDARERNDQGVLSALHTTFAILSDTSCDIGNRELSIIFEDMADAARDATMGVGWKSDIPSIEAIKEVLSSRRHS